ncbi:ribosome modulation factor [Methylocystis sp. JAN1]|uniref:ribosome modulation factor n=1 Tax=Methylocystis sp. JAN1 TaxID=3397211 RepID=UPI003FA1C749
MEKSESAFAEGVDAFARGKSRAECPYPSEDDRQKLWLEGWETAKRADDLYVDGPP